MPDISDFHIPRHTLGRRIFQFLGTMDLAVTLLLTLAVASIIGTVLQQNQPYADYLIKFGPFWFEVFESAGLYDVYSALWFLAILTLLVISTSACLIRNTPSMLKDMWNLRTQAQQKSLQAMQHKDQWSIATSIDIAATELQTELENQGFRVKQTPSTDQTLVSAMRGGMNRLGYIATHLAIVIICVGGLLDSNLPLKLAQWQGAVKVETRDLAINDVPVASRLAVGSQAFKGSINIPEGGSSAIAFVAMRDGYLIQELPFKLEVQDFRIEHYATGQPKSFATDLLVHDSNVAQPLAATISVNHPLIYKGYAIYQASFSDGGSKLLLEAWPLDQSVGSDPVSFETKVFENRQMYWGQHSLKLEMLSFQLFNINPDPTKDEPKRLRNFGPSFGFKLREDTGEALEYRNYMLPIERNGREFYLSGVRTSPAEDFRYLYLPVDSDGGLAAFNHFLMKLRNDQLLEKLANEVAVETLAAMPSHSEKLEQSLYNSLLKLVAMFVRGGFAEVNEFIETGLPVAARDALGTAYLSMLREMLARVYFSEATAAELADESQLLFLQDAIAAVGSLSRYGAPVFFLLTDYNHVEASGLQVTRSPGKPIVYLGCALLIMGVFLLFYLPQRRLWLLVKKQGCNSQILLAGMSNRNPREFRMFFEQTALKLKQLDGNSKR